jgi:hypothetical protein
MNCRLIAVAGALAVALSACSGSKSTPSSSSVTVSFGGTTLPSAVATQTGVGGTWKQATLKGSSVTFSVSSGPYAVAYACTEGTLTENEVYELSTSDSRSPTVACPATSTSTASTLSGTIDVSAVSGAAGANFYCLDGASSASVVTGTYSLTCATGTQDIVVQAIDPSDNTLAVKIVRSQALPAGASTLNISSLGTPDTTSTQTYTLSGIPSGENSPTAAVYYFTSNGTEFLLSSSVTQTYAVVSSTDSASGDYYEAFASAAASGGAPQQVDFQLFNPAKALSLVFPAVWTYAGPTPASFPTFTTGYTGFTNSGAVSYEAIAAWASGSQSIRSVVVASSNWLKSSGATLALPNLTALTGFAAAPATGTNVTWTERINSATNALFFYAATPPLGDTQYVYETGTYSAP